MGSGIGTGPGPGGETLPNITGPMLAKLGLRFVSGGCSWPA